MNTSKKFKQVSIIGSAHISNENIEKLCLVLGSALASANYSIVCGGLKGTMEAVCKGFKTNNSHQGHTIGILPSYNCDTANPYIDVVIPTGLDIGRNHLVVSSGFAVIAIGGGAGTLSEIAIASQIGKPIILLKGGGGWADQLEDHFLDPRKNAPIYHTDSINKVIKLLYKIETKGVKREGNIDSGHNR